MTKKRGLQEQIDGIHECITALARRVNDLDELLGDGGYERLRARVDWITTRIKGLEDHVKALDRETHAPVRPETWRHIENVTTPHVNTTYPNCGCNHCKKGLNAGK